LKKRPAILRHGKWRGGTVCCKADIRIVHDWHESVLALQPEGILTRRSQPLPCAASPFAKRDFF
jgi:hypothetical protein